MTVRILIFLVLAALLEVGGDALIRNGLQRGELRCCWRGRPRWWCTASWST